jgi:hypothetical protein
MPLVVADGGRFDFPGHEALGQSNIGSAVFVPSDENADYFIESTRYHYAGPIGRSNQLFFSAYPIPVMASASTEATGRVVSGDNQIAIVEMMNAGDSELGAQFTAYGSSGVGVMSTDVGIPAKGARHMVLNPSSSGQADSFRTSSY